MRSLYIICAKCGSDDIEFLIREPDEDFCGVAMMCDDCATVTFVEEFNEFIEDKK